MGVDVPDVGGREAALLERLAHGAHDTRPFGIGRGHVIGIAGRAISGNLGDGGSATIERMFK